MRAYQARTRHHPGRYAAGPGWLDWDHQPDPFRRYDGAPLLPLDLVPPGDDPPYELPFRVGAVPPRPLDRAFVSQLCMDAWALSAWKKAGDATWSLRVDPSSGNLHPTEAHLLLPALPGLNAQPAVLHYSPYLHALEERLRLQPDEWAALTAGLPSPAVFVALTSTWWRESWKYGERAWRYCQHDLGHCLGTLAIAAAAMGWEARLLEGATDPQLARLLGVGDPHAGDLPPCEREQPEALVLLSPADRRLDLDAWRAWRLAVDPAPDRFVGRSSRLSTAHVDWEVIDEAHHAGLRLDPAAPFDAVALDPPLPVAGPDDGGAPFGLRRIVHQRRSAVDMDGRTGITRDAFLHMLRKCLPHRDQVPWTSLSWAPRVHLLLFVHRVDGLMPGLYLLARDPSAAPRLRAMLDPALAWEEVQADLPLWRLQEADVRAVAQSVSCGQAIASDGVFAVAMLGELRSALDDWGPWAWRRLHWEAGLIGQLLYLEAEATGIRATGIGCFFDDPTHQLVLRPEPWREDRLVDLYHFTMGGPVDDDRLQTLPAYHHRDAALAAEPYNPTSSRS